METHIYENHMDVKPSVHYMNIKNCNAFLTISIFTVITKASDLKKCCKWRKILKKKKKFYIITYI